jgi:hypothetical protein
MRRRSLFKSVPAAVWASSVSGTALAWVLPWMPANTTRDVCLLACVVLIAIAVRGLYMVPNKAERYVRDR